MRELAVANVIVTAASGSNVTYSLPEPVPTASLQVNGQANAVTINKSGFTYPALSLSWTSSSASSCIASAYPTDANWTGSVATNGTKQVSAPSASKTYTINCVGAGGSTPSSVGVTLGGSVNTLGGLTAPISSATNNAPVAVFDAITSGVATGWSVDPDAPSVPNLVGVYIDGTASTNLVATISANATNPASISVFPQYTGNHGFSFTIPSTYRDGASHQLYFKSIDTAGGASTVAVGSPKSFTLSSTVASLDQRSLIASITAAINALIAELQKNLGE